VATSTADITTFKFLINSRLSTEHAEMMMMDIKNYYVGTPLPRYEYLHIPLTIIPDEVVEKYNLRSISVDGWVNLEIRKGMYGLKQAGLVADQLLQNTFGTIWLLPSQTYSRAMVAQIKTNRLHINCG
jgi:hypothetical protein